MSVQTPQVTFVVLSWMLALTNPTIPAHPEANKCKTVAEPASFESLESGPNHVPQKLATLAYS